MLLYAGRLRTSAVSSTSSKASTSPRRTASLTLKIKLQVSLKIHPKRQFVINTPPTQQSTVHQVLQNAANIANKVQHGDIVVVVDQANYAIPPRDLVESEHKCN